MSPPLGKGSIALKTCWSAGDHPILSDKVIYLGLIVHEVILNSLKYAFEGIDFPEINFELIGKKDQYQLTIRDNGVGFENEKVADSAEHKGLGMKLIASLTAQLGGTYLYQSDKGAAFLLTFPSR